MARPTRVTARSDVTSTAPTAMSTTKKPSPIQAASRRPPLIGWPVSDRIKPRTGIALSVASWRSVAAVSAEPAAAVSTPDAASIRYCNVAPAAAPAGTTRLSALAAS